MLLWFAVIGWPRVAPGAGRFRKGGGLADRYRDRSDRSVTTDELAAIAEASDCWRTVSPSFDPTAVAGRSITCPKGDRFRSRDCRPGPVQSLRNCGFASGSDMAM